ncbi:hypothetical protein JXA34_01555 [Patescibacteria group bacterium]|nr:hypothetical protein [Patescibacteria group bacterium]
MYSEGYAEFSKSKERLDTCISEFFGELKVVHEDTLDGVRRRATGRGGKLSTPIGFVSPVDGGLTYFSLEARAAVTMFDKDNDGKPERVVLRFPSGADTSEMIVHEWTSAAGVAGDSNEAAKSDAFAGALKYFVEENWDAGLLDKEFPGANIPDVPDPGRRRVPKLGSAVLGAVAVSMSLINAGCGAAVEGAVDDMTRGVDLLKQDFEEGGAQGVVERVVGDYRKVFMDSTDPVVVDAVVEDFFKYLEETGQNAAEARATWQEHASDVGDSLETRLKRWLDDYDNSTSDREGLRFREAWTEYREEVLRNQAVYEERLKNVPGVVFTPRGAETVVGNIDNITGAGSGGLVDDAQGAFGEAVEDVQNQITNPNN